MLHRLSPKMLQCSLDRIFHQTFGTVDVHRLSRIWTYPLGQLHERLTLIAELLYLEDVAASDILLLDRSGHGQML